MHSVFVVPEYGSGPMLKIVNNEEYPITVKGFEFYDIEDENKTATSIDLLKGLVVGPNNSFTFMFCDDSMRPFANKAHIGMKYKKSDGATPQGNTVEIDISFDYLKLFKTAWCFNKHN